MEQVLLPHLDAAYNLARWLLKSDEDAQDVVQDAYLRAFRAFSTLRDTNDARSWLLSIVRNRCYTLFEKRRVSPEVLVRDEETLDLPSHDPDPEELLLKKGDQTEVTRALESLPAIFREVLVLSELEGLAYKEIADVTGAPIGTVMSRISRARARLKEVLR